jgi:hypothetical protein
MRPEIIKTSGYLVSSVSVVLLGIAAYPGAEKAGLLLALFAGMATSLAGMALRWFSYEVEKRDEKAGGGKPSPTAEPRSRPTPSSGASPQRPG